MHKTQHQPLQTVTQIESQENKPDTRHSFSPTKRIIPFLVRKYDIPLGVYDMCLDISCNSIKHVYKSEIHK